MFYDNFERVCRLKGKSPSGTCYAIGNSRSLANGWKRLGSVPSREILDKLCIYLDCDLKEFFTNENGVLDKEQYDRVLAKEKVSNISSDENINEFAKIYNACSARQKHQLMSFIYDFEDKVLNKKQDYC